MEMTRRQFLAVLMAGGVVTAEEIWLPGRKLISIPKPPIITRAEIELLNKLRASYDGGRSFFKVPTQAVLANRLDVYLTGPKEKVTIQHPVTLAWIRLGEFGSL